MAENSETGNVQGRLRALRQAYQQRLCNDLETIASLLGLCQQSDEAPRVQAELHHALHKLAGSAGTFGFSQLGAQARRIEQLLAKQLAGGDRAAVDLSKTQTDDWLSDLNSALSADQSHTAGHAVASEAVPNKDQPRIVLLERDNVLAQYISQQLESFGFAVDWVADADALDDLDRSSLDLLLVDHRASAHVGLAENPVTFWCERLSGFSCPIIFMGAEESYQARLNAVRCGGQGYFAKPLDVPKLAGYVARLLKAQDARPERVLLVEDDADLAGHCQTVLSEAGMEVRWLGQPEALVEVAIEFAPELILMDLWLPGASGAELVLLLAQYEHWANLPVVYLSSEPCPAQRAEALKSGGDAFLEKPLDPDLLISICHSRVRRFREMQEAMTRDSLTGLLKHASIKDALHAQWQYARRYEQTFSVVMLDIDHFKAVNDTHGHAVGDLVIGSVGTLLRQHFRSTDYLGRYGGEEFALVLPACSGDKASELVNAVREAFAAVRFVGQDQAFSCTLSGGVVDSAWLSDASHEALIDLADKAMYQAKRSGRDRVCLAEPEAADQSDPQNE